MRLRIGALLRAIDRSGTAPAPVPQLRCVPVAESPNIQWHQYDSHFLVKRRGAA
jgi:hypothetical protein